KIDPAAAATIPSKNRQRLIRAIEVYRLTGRPISVHWHSHKRNQASAPGGFYKVGLNPPKEILDRKIEERVEMMLEQGLLAEVRALRDKWGRGAPGLRLIGYKEIVSYLEGKLSLEAAIALLIRNTRQY